MGKSSKAQRLRAAQPAAPDKGWCDHCLDMLHTTNGQSYIASEVLESYTDMRDGHRLDRKYSHAETMAWLSHEVDGMMQALRSSGDRYFYETGLQCKAEFDPESGVREPWTEQELRDYEALVAREEARRAAETSA